MEQYFKECHDCNIADPLDARSTECTKVECYNEVSPAAMTKLKTLVVGAVFLSGIVTGALIVLVFVRFVL